ncbi:MAG: hypothetical protein FOGNACKC_06246 [Anaerolineae bacterium]|nr:hypothetical protein [Anaerolineae bacterium]
MFTNIDTQVFDQVDSFDKLDEIGNVYFPKLGALLIKGNELISRIYGFQPHQTYFTTYAPSRSHRKNAVFSPKRNHTAQASVGLRAQGVPSNLTTANGVPSKKHFAQLSFFVAYDKDRGADLGVGFDPYTLKYTQYHRDMFADWAARLKLSNLVWDGMIPIAVNKKADSLPEFLRLHRAQMRTEFVPQVDASNENLANLVISFAAMFPLLNVFTQLSNNEADIYANYVEKFTSWWNIERENYLQTFTVEPIKPALTKISEAQVRSYFENLLGHSFPTVKPDWLKSPTTKARLELDGYCEGLRLAFEYQGEYHYFYVPKHSDGKTPEQVQRTDAYKQRVCQKRGVDLIQVPYWEKNNLNFVIDALRRLGRTAITEILAGQLRVAGAGAFKPQVW